MIYCTMALRHGKIHLVALTKEFPAAEKVLEVVKPSTIGRELFSRQYLAPAKADMDARFPNQSCMVRFNHEGWIVCIGREELE